jgi:hypothetical protein
MFFITAFMYFMPKESVYYFLEKQLQQQEIIISSESVMDNGFSLTVTGADISVKSISSAVISRVDVGFFVVYNFINLQNIKLSSTVKSFIPLHIDNIDIVYSIFNPLNIKIYGIGEFGEIDGLFNLKTQHLHLVLKPSKLMIRKNQNTLRNFKKDAKGEFSYDQNFQF